ncbi:MAG: rhomboid family intramembrane serine protease [Verrucomicrobiales bacterium]
MGLDNRDYVRYTDRQGGFGGAGGNWPPAVKALLAINVVVFLAQLFSTPPQGVSSPVQQWLGLDWGHLKSGQIWRLLTYSFCHSTGELFHIIFNMLGLIFFGRPMERVYGSAEFLAFYLVSAVVGGIAFVLVNLVIGPPGMVIGASAATLATLVLFALHYPRQEVLLAFVLPVQVRWVVAFIIAADLLRALSARAGVDVGVAFAAHLGGIVFAYIYWKSNIRLAPWFHKVSPVRPKSRVGGGARKPKAKKSDLSTAGRSKLEIDQQVDALLQKISDKGFQSLSDKEKKFLEKASDKFGKR